MSQTKVKKLTPAQEAQIPVYRSKWRAIALSTGPIDRSQAAESITLAYRAMAYAPLRYGKRDSTTKVKLRCSIGRPT